MIIKIKLKFYRLQIQWYKYEHELVLLKLKQQNIIITVYLFIYSANNLFHQILYKTNTCLLIESSEIIWSYASLTGHHDKMKQGLSTHQPSFFFFPINLVNKMWMERFTVHTLFKSLRRKQKLAASSKRSMCCLASSSLLIPFIVLVRYKSITINLVYLHKPKIHKFNIISN